MFDLLKKKIGGFVDSLSKKVVGERKPEEIDAKVLGAEIKANAGAELTKSDERALMRANDKEAESSAILAPEPTPKRVESAIQKPAEIKEQKRTAFRKTTEIGHAQIKAPPHREPTIHRQESKQEEYRHVPTHYPVRMERPEPKREAAPAAHVPAATPLPREKEMKQKEFNVAPSLFTKLKSVVMPEVTIKDSDVSSVMEDFEMQLLTADVALPVAEEIAKDVRSKLVGSSVKSSQLESHVNSAIYDSILEVTKQDSFDIFQMIAECEKPLRVLFIGPNGAGKTTAIAKFAHMLTKNGKTCVIAAADTFRAAAIEQTSEHAKRLNVPVIRHDYGSDPAAVAFDAVKYAKAKGIDVVLIDSAGRQETNRNLIEQLKKIERVAQPDLKLFVGEGISGNALLSQVSEFHKAIGLDGVILTKMDVDAKGGTVISIKKATGVPILYLGVGQGYDDLVAFDSSYIAKRIMAS